MKLTKKITLVLGLVAAAGASFAQTSPTGTAPAGVLGQKYAELSLGTADIKNLSRNQHSASVGVNLPVTPTLDLGASYSYDWMRGPFSGYANTFGTTATAYAPWRGVKPFLGAGVGYSWARFAGSREETILWALAAGVEIPLQAVTVTPSIFYTDDFKRSAFSSQQLSYEVELSHWFSPTAGAFGSVGRVDVLHSPARAWTYELGLRFKF